MTKFELQDYFEQEGMDYYLRYKNNDWHYLEDKKLLKKLHKFVKIANDIEDYLERNPD